MKQAKESNVFTELRRIRDEMLAEEKRVGSEKFWGDVSRRGREYARKHGLKYVESPASPPALHGKPGKKRSGQEWSGMPIRG